MNLGQQKKDWNWTQVLKDLVSLQPIYGVTQFLTLFLVGANNFELGNFKNRNFDTDLVSKNGRPVRSKKGNFKINFENNNIKNSLGTMKHVRHQTGYCG